MKLKLFCAKRNCGYCGGLLIVAAHDFDEAYELYKKWAVDTGKSWIYSCYKDGDEHYAYINLYPRAAWYEKQGVKVIVDSPRVIDEDGFTEKFNPR